jgi:gliding motility-associated-like protein
LTSVEDKNVINNSLNAATNKTTLTVSAGVAASISNGPPACNLLTTFDITASGSGVGGSYLWSSGQTTPTITVTVSGAYTVTAKDAQGCTGTASISVQLNTTPAPPVLNTPATTLICQGSNIALTATGADNYIWSKDGSVIANEISATYKATAAGTYTVVGVNKTSGCTRAATGTGVALTFAQKPTASFTYDSYCKDFPVHFNNTTNDPAGDAVYVWNFGDGQTSTVKQAVHTYTKVETVMMILEAASKSCPSLKSTSTPVTVKIEEAAPPVRYEAINALKNRASTIDGRSIGDTYAWTPVDGLNNATISTPTVTPVKEQTYKLTITTKAGCVTVDTQLVRIFSKAEIFVPKGFTPNNDGVNDRMFPIAVGMNKLNYFKIFNRWGVLMYETQQAGSGSTGGGWDGTFKGTLQPMDAYTWIAEGVDVDGQLIKISGSTVLMR